MTASTWRSAAILAGRCSNSRRRRRGAVGKALGCVGVGDGVVQQRRVVELHHRRGRSFGCLVALGDQLVHGVAQHAQGVGHAAQAGAVLAQALVREHGVHEVYITLPLGTQPRIVELLEQVQDTTASMFFVPDVFGISIIQGRLQDMNGVPVVGICETPFTGTNELAKRISDIVLSSIILVLISPLLLAIAIGVKLSSPGPAIFRQRRNGLDGEEIEVSLDQSRLGGDSHWMPALQQYLEDSAR